jgi:hypothetical protein
VNIEETKKAIEVMQAFVDGKTIQIKTAGRWFDTIMNPLWDWYETDYRIKPTEPKEIWVNEYADWNGHGCITEAQALDTAHAGVIRKAVHYREVIEE